MQSLLWAQFKITQGLSAVHFQVFDDEELQAGCIGYFSGRSTGARLLVSPEGPVMPWQDQKLTEQYMRALDGAVKQFCREQKLSAWRIEPHLTVPLPPILKNFSPAPIDLVPRETLYLDVRPAPETIRASLHPKARYNIGLAQRKGVRIFEDNSTRGIQSLYKILTEASRRDDFFLEPPSFFEDLMSCLGAGPESFGKSGSQLPDDLGAGPGTKIILAAHDDDILGGLLLLHCGNRVTYLYGGVANHKRNLMAGYLLQWQAIMITRSLGASVYDFYGFIEENAPNHFYSRFSQFKKKFGGSPMRFCGAREQFFMETLTDSIVRAFQEIDLQESACKAAVDYKSGKTLTITKGD
jgi:lipid II:glycine glycyltransferase (peptidoglycan interpeptide bridge formation enzyme)